MQYPNGYVKTDYMEEILDKKRQKRTIRWLIDSITKLTPDFDAIVVSGHSGVIPGSILANLFGKSLVIVRKNKRIEQHHSYLRVEGDMGFHTYIIIDDFIETGKTLKRIFKEVNKLTSRDGASRVCLGVYLYSGKDYTESIFQSIFQGVKVFVKQHKRK